MRLMSRTAVITATTTAMLTIAPAAFAGTTTQETSQSKFSSCSKVQQDKRFESRAYIKATIDDSNNRITNTTANFIAINFWCTYPYSQYAFASNSRMTDLIIVNTTSTISNCRVSGGINIGKKDSSGHLTGECLLNTSKTNAYLGYTKSLGGLPRYEKELVGFQASYSGSGTLTAQNTVESSSSRGSSTIIAHAVLDLR